MYLRHVLFAVALTLGAATALPAQQSSDSTRATVSQAPDSTASATTPWRNYASADTMPSRARGNAFANAPVVESGGTTIYVSTLALVLGIIIIVLLIR